MSTHQSFFEPPITPHGLSAEGPLRQAVTSDGRTIAYENLKARLETNAIQCGVIGLGFIGGVLMDALLAAGLVAAGYDRAAAAVERYSCLRAALGLSNGRNSFTCGAEPAALAACEVIFVAVRNPVHDDHVDEEPLRAAARVIKAHPVRPLLVIMESTVAPGTTRRFADEIGAADTHVFVAHAPERLGAGQDHLTLRTMPHLVAGVDHEATDLARAMLEKICDTVVCVSAPEVSEVSKLLENAFLSVNIGLISEITRLSAGLGIQAQEVCAAAATKTRGFMPFYPGAGLGGHCLPNDLALLAQSARKLGWEPELLNGAIEVNERAPTLVVDRLDALLEKRGITVSGAEVLLVGVGFKPGSHDTIRSPAIDVGRILRTRGARVCYLDHRIADFRIDDRLVERIEAAQVMPGRFTAGIILSGDDAVDEARLRAATRVLLDAGGSRVHRAQNTDIESL